MPRTFRLVTVVLLWGLVNAPRVAIAKRAPPAEVLPVVVGDVRYEVPHFQNPCGQHGGCVVAYDDASDAQLWAETIYCVHYSSDMEQDVQDVFITSLTWEDGKLRIVNEKDQQFTLDPTTREVAGDERSCSGGCFACSLGGAARPRDGAAILTAVALFAIAALMAHRRRRAH
jgi:hypothetical protein